MLMTPLDMLAAAPFRHYTLSRPFHSLFSDKYLYFSHLDLTYIYHHYTIRLLYLIKMGLG